MFVPSMEKAADGIDFRASDGEQNEPRRGPREKRPGDVLPDFIAEESGENELDGKQNEHGDCFQKAEIHVQQEEHRDEALSDGEE
jgi:hypothetical protein